MQPTDKRALRRQLLAVRAAISAEEKCLLDGALCRSIAAHRYFGAADALLCYLPMRGEPDLTPLFAIAKARNIPVYLPRCDENGMRFLLFTSENEPVPDRFGILAPPADAPEAALTADTLCLAPGLAAGRDGTRLGYGGGFYDRFLPRFGGYVLFPLYARLVLDTLPCEAHDYLIDPQSIITEKGEISDAKLDPRATDL